MSSGPLFLRLGVPTGMEDLLEGLAREVLRHQPKDIYKFAAVHFEGLLLQRQTTQSAALTVSTRAENQEGQTEKAKAVAAEDVPPVRPPHSPTSDSGKASATSSPPVSPSRSPQQIKPVRTKLTNIGEKLPSPILQQAMTKAFTEESEPESSVNSGATASEDKILGRDVVSSPDTSSKIESTGFGFAKGLVASPVKDLLSEGSRSVSSGLSSVASRAEQMESDLKRRADSAKSDATSKISSARSDIESKATEVQSRIEEAKTGLGAMVTEAEGRVTEAKGGIEQAAADAEAKLAEAKADVESKAAELEEKASAAIKEAAEEAEQRVSAVREGVESKIEEAESKVGEVRAQVESTAAEAESKIEQVKADVESKVAEAESKIDEAKHEIEAKVEEVKSEFETKASEIKSEAQKVASEVESKVEEVKSEAEKKINDIRAEAESAATELQSKIEESKEEADKKVAEIQSEAAGVVSKVEATIEEVQSEAVKKVEEIKSEAESVVVEAESQIDAAQNEMKNIVSEVENQVESAKSDVETKINEAVVEIKSEAESVVAQAEDKVTEAEKQVAETVAQVESQVENVKSEVEQKISDAMTEFDQLKSQAEETTAEIQQEAEQVVSSVSIKITEAQNEIENEIEEKVNIVENEFTSVVDKAEDFATQAESEIKSQVEAAVTEAVSENIARAEEKISQTVSEVKSELETDFGALKETAENIAEQTKNIANEGEAKFVKFQEELNPDAITAALEEKQQEISEELSDLATGAATALEENIEEVKAAIEQTEAEKEEEMRLVEKNALEVIENVIAEAESKLEAAAAESLELTEDVTQQLEESLQTQIDNASDEVAAIEAEVDSKAEALVDFAESAKSEVEEKASAIVGVLDELEETKAEAHNALVELEEAAETQIEAVQETQEQALEEASVIVSELIEDIEEKQSQAVEDASEIVSDVADAVQEVALDPVLEEVENAIAKIEQETPVVLSPEFPSTADEVSTTILNDETPVEEILQNESSILIEEAAIEAAQLSPRSVTSEAIDAPADLLDSEPSSPRSAKPTGLLLPVATIDITPATPLPSPSNDEEEGGIFDKVTFDADALIESTQNALNNNEDKIEEVGVAAATERAILIESAASELAQDEEEEPSESQSSTGLGNEAVGAVSRVVIRSSISEGVKGQQQSAGEEAGESEAEQQAFSPVQEDKEIADTLIAGVENSESSEDLTVTASEPAEVLSERTASSRDVPSLEMDDSKKTVTVDPIDLTALRGSSSPSSPEKQQAPLLQQIEEESSVETSSQQLQEQLVDEDASLPEQLEQAATKIQASFRGYKTRKALGDKVDDASAEKNSMPLQEEFHTLPEMITNESVVHENVETPAAGEAADETNDCAGDEIACVMDPELLKDRPDLAPRSEQNSPPPRSPINEPEETQIESLEPEICGVVDSDAVAPADQQQPEINLETPAEENSVELVNENVSPPIEPQSDAVLEISPERPEPKIETADNAADAVLIDSESAAAVNASDVPVEEKIEGTPLEPEIIIFAPSEPLDGVSESDPAEIDQLENTKTDEISVPVESAPADVSDAATSDTLELEAAASTANESEEILTGENSESPIKIIEEIQDNVINFDDTGVAEIGDSIVEVVNNTPALAEESNIKEDEINSEGPKTVNENNDLVEISEIPNTDDDTIIVEAMDASETVGVESLIPNLENINVEVESNVETLAPISAEAINDLVNTTDNGENNQSENSPIMEESIVITTIENDDDTVIVEAIELVSETVKIEDSEQNANVNELIVDETEPQIVALDVEQVDIPQAEINTEEENPSLNNLINFDQDDAQAIATNSKETEHLGTEMESVKNEDDAQENDESGTIEVAPVDENNTLIEGSSNETKEAVVVSEPVDILGSVIHSPEMNLTPDNYKIDPEIVSDILAEEVEAAHLMGLLTPRLDENDAPEPKRDSPLVPNEEIFPMEIEDPAEPDAAISVTGAVEMTDEAKAHDAQTRAINDGETAQNADENLSSEVTDAANLIEISKEPDEAEAVKSQTEEKSSTEPLRGVSAADTISPQSRMGSSLEPEAPSTPVSALEELFISSTHLAATPIAFLPDERASPLSQEELQAALVHTSQVSRNLSCSSGECADVSASLTDEPPAEAPPATTTTQDALVSDEATPSRRTLRREDALASEAGGDADAPGAAVRHSGEFHDSLVLPPALLAGAGVRPDAQPEAAGRDDRLDQQPADEMSFLDRAATRIQATFRGFRARSELKPKIEEPPPATKADHDAAAKIQAGFRGYKVRKEMKERSLGSQQTSPTHDEEEKSAVKIQAGVRGFLTRQRLKHDKEALPARPRPPPPDPDQDDVNDAVVKIQAGFRGYKARQEVKKIRQNN